MNELLSVAGITTIIALGLTVLFQYVPVLRTKWASVPGEAKKAIVLGMYIVVGAVVAFGGCIQALGNIVPKLGCVPLPDFLTYAFAVVIAVGAGQGVFGLLPEAADVTVAKAVRDEGTVPPIPVAGQ